VAQARRLATRRPGATHHGLLRYSALVLEDYPGPAAPGVFLPGATAAVATAGSLPRRAPATGAWAVAATSASPGGCARHARGDSARG
jgi:hypothetical protein